jgi:nitrite reductase (NADH) large subunit
MDKLKLVMIGNGMAGVRTLEELLRIAPDLYDITVFGAEPHPNYNRILLSPLAGEQTLDEIVLNPLAWYARHGITLHLGQAVTKIDRIRRTVTADGTTAAYDRLLIATGSQPFVPPVPGADLDGVLSYRDIADTQAMIEAARTHRHAVVIGGGLLGLEAANGLALRGMAVTVVHLGEWLLNRQLDPQAGRAAGSQPAPARPGLRAGRADGRAARRCPRPGARGAAAGRPRTAGRPGGDGRRHRAAHALAEQAGLLCQRGIVVNDTLQTVTDPRIYAVGECGPPRRGLWPGGAAVRAGPGLRHPPGPVRHRPLPGQPDPHPAAVNALGRRLHGRRGHRRHPAVRPGGRPLQARAPGRPAGGRVPVWRHRTAPGTSSCARALPLRDRLMFGERACQGAPAEDPAWREAA